MLGPLIKNAPVIGSCYGFATTAVKVYNATTPAGAIKVAVKGVIIDYTPPIIKYPALCAALATCDVAIGEAIVESAL